MYRAPHKCPVCNGKLLITQMTCSSCGTRLEGQFEGCRFCSLSPEESRFLLIFIKNRGSIKDVEREMGVSYPTVRAALDGLIASLGLTSDGQPPDGTGDPETAEQKAGPSAENGKAPGAKTRPANDPRKAQARKDILALLAQHRITADEAANRLKEL